MSPTPATPEEHHEEDHCQQASERDKARSHQEDGQGVRPDEEEHTHGAQGHEDEGRQDADRGCGPSHFGRRPVGTRRPRLGGGEGRSCDAERHTEEHQDVRVSKKRRQTRTRRSQGKPYREHAPGLRQSRHGPIVTGIEDVLPRFAAARCQTDTITPPSRRRVSQG